MTAHIILAAGSQERWLSKEAHGMILPSIKQLVKVNGRTLIEDVQKKFPESIVITHRKEIKDRSFRWFEPENNEVTLATLFSTRDLWQDWTVILLGDVLYGKETIKKINSQAEPIMFYGDKGEIYAIKFSLALSVNIVLAIHKIIQSEKFKPKFGKLWNLYRELIGEDFRVHNINGLFTFVKDCRDFDNKQQYVKYARDKQI